MKTTRLTPLLLTLVGASAQAQFANNTAIWSIPPSTQANGTVNDNLALTAIPSGLIVTGTWQVTLPPGPQAGILLQLEGARLMQTPLYAPTFNMSMSVPGSDYITHPASGNGITTGSGTGSIDGIAASVCGWNFPNSGSGNYF